jgi:hypothetical protein
MNPDFSPREPPPLPEHPPAPDRDPPPLPPRPAEPPPRRRFPRRLLFVAVLLGALFLGPLRSEVRFVDDAGRIPTDFDVTLRSGGSEKKARVEKGRLRLLRGRWKELEVTDPFYEITVHPVRGRNMSFTVARNLRLRLKQASTGQASVPQRGDPDPRDD